MKAIQQIIEDLSHEDGFGTVVLTNASGLALATSEDRTEAESLAAVVADVLRASAGISVRLGWGPMSEVMLLSEDAQRGVLCRTFKAGKSELVLAFFIRPQHTYWRATTQAIRNIQQVWSQSGFGDSKG